MKKNEHFIRAWVDESEKNISVMINAKGFEVAGMILAILTSLHERGYDAAVRNVLFAFLDGLEFDED